MADNAAIRARPRKLNNLLAPIYGWFTEGFKTLDLKEPRALLDALSGPCDLRILAHP